MRAVFWTKRKQTTGTFCATAVREPSVLRQSRHVLHICNSGATLFSLLVEQAGTVLIDSSRM